MTVTEAERQRAQTMLTGTATVEGLEEGQKEAEVWELKLRTMCDCPVQKDVTVICRANWVSVS